MNLSLVLETSALHPYLPILSALITVITAAALMGLFSKKINYKNKHVFITGGSKGIGLGIAKAFVFRGAHVTVAARNKTDLANALEELQAAAKSHNVDVKLNSISVDTSNQQDLAQAVATAEKAAGPIDVLLCNAGFSKPGLFIDQSIDDFERHIQVNYLGTVKTVKEVLPGMVQRKQGHVIITTSVLSVLGFAGYTAYAPSKWALRGLADSLHNELQGTGVRVSVIYPPDTDTPGYATEELTKPELCKVVNDAVGSNLFTVDKVVSVIMKGMDRGDYHLLCPDFGSNLLINKMSAVAPKAIWLPVTMFLSPIVELVTSFVGSGADRAARKYNEKHGYGSEK